MNGSTVQKYVVPLAAGMQAIYTSARPAAPAYWRHADWLGSSWLASNANQTVYYDGAYAPFGENYAGTGTVDRSFTGQNEDTVTNYLDFPFRMYTSTQSRWMVPDPAGLAAVDITNPQTWNRYAYLGNNPLNAVDSLGLDDCSTDPDSPICNGGGWGAGGGGIGGCNPTDYGTAGAPCTSNGQVYGGWGGGSAAGGSGGYGCGDPTYLAAHPLGCGLNQGTPYFPGGGGSGGETLGIPNGLSTGSWGIPLPLPTNLPCPAGLSFLCGGIDPGMEAESTASPSCVGVFFTQSAAHFFGMDAQDVTDLVHRVITMSPGYMANIAVPASKAARGGLSWSQYFSKAYASKLALAEKAGTGFFVGQAIWAQIRGLWDEYQAAKAGNCE